MADEWQRIGDLSQTSSAAFLQSMSIQMRFSSKVPRSGPPRASPRAPLKFQVAARDRLAGLIAWMSTHPEVDLSIERLAARVAVSPRNLSRQFVKAFGLPPGRVVEMLRLDAARMRIATTRGPIDRIAESVGFRSGDVFRRAFKRRFNTTPRNYRDRFRFPVRHAKQ